MPCSAPGFEGATMTDPIIALGVAIALGAYLTYTLLRPEKF
jgi:K+-transporting ATPase KdpF subunit